ncbi:hypothetical protein BV22DRAFT_1060155 [Leucogyrophana mollusca]|uniref:Uncharacterized protein n=1 Tax=Leucogyrophana mollusca TaxID=85980 RepID=A0ACB8BR58_9AGAM|nr:hypothetical protein BV22DRAFT_1060155 [Leucogyrophana mollusca]
MPQSGTDFASLSLFPATPEQLIISRKRAWPMWGGGLTEEQYLQRDDVMDVMEHAADGKLITWVLAPRADPGTLDFMCSCETFRRRGVLLPATQDGKQGDLQEVPCYGVASVFTPPWNRRKGYGSHMMSLLHWVIASRSPEFNLGEFPEAWGQPPPKVELAGDGHFSVLYSDIGSEFYNNSGPGGHKGGGWEVKEAFSTVWKVPQQPETTEEIEGGWSWLKESDLQEVWDEEVGFIKDDLTGAPSTNTTSQKTTVSFLPDKGVAAFQSVRALFGRAGEVSMDIWGVKMDDPTSGGGSDRPTITYATWSVDARPPPPTLIVTRLRASERTFPGLLRKIQEAARQSGIGKVEVWNLPGDLLKVATELNGETFERTEHLPAIRWYGKGLATKDVEWAFNEKSVLVIQFHCI